MPQRSTIRLAANPKGLVEEYSAVALQAAKSQRASAQANKTNPVRAISHSENPPRYSVVSSDRRISAQDAIKAPPEFESDDLFKATRYAMDETRKGRTVYLLDRITQKVNPATEVYELATEPYTSEFPFELIRYDYLVPPTYDIENEQYAADIADSMETSGWTGRPLWGMFDEENSWEEDEDDFLTPVVELRTGSHRWFALGILMERGTWPENLPTGYVPVVVMRRSEVSPRVWDAWAEADWYRMKELGDEGVGPRPIVQLMRAERNPRPGITARLHRVGGILESQGTERIGGAVRAFTSPLDAAFQARDALTNPELHTATPIEFYELWDMSVGGGKRIGVFRDLHDFNERCRVYWQAHPMAKLEKRTIKTNPDSEAIDRYLLNAGFTYQGEMDPQPYSPMGSRYGVYKHPDFGGVAVQKSGQWHRFSRGGRQGLIDSGKGLESLERSLGVKANPALTDRAHRYRANRNAPAGPRKCAFCGATKDVQVGHLDGHEENDDPDNLVWNCRSCNAILSHQFKKLGLGRRTRQYNPATSWQQYGLAAAAMSGRTDAMPAEVGREIVLSTPPAERSQFMKEIAAHRKNYNPRDYDGKGAKNIAEWVLAVGAVGSHPGNYEVVGSTMSDKLARQIIHDTPKWKRSDFNREVLKRRYARRGEVPF